MDWDNETDVLKALALLYSLQTSDERIYQQTVEDNGVGFNATDAEFLTSVAEQMLVRGKGVSEKQLNLIQVKLRKYQRQINTFGIDKITLPATAIVYGKNGDANKDIDGIIKIDGDVILFKPVTFPTTQIKSIGFTWGRHEPGHWGAQLNLSRFEQLREMFPKYELDESVQSWLSRIELLAATTIVNEGDPFAFQTEAEGFLIRSNKSMLALAPGLGKTRVSIMAIKKMGGRTLVVCPKSLMYNWKHEITKWVGEESRIWHGFAGRVDTNWVIANYETVFGYMILFDEKKKKNKNGKTVNTRVNWRLSKPFQFDNIIVDESVLIKNRKANRSKAIDTIVNKMRGVKRVFLLSGSPTTKFYDDLWHQFHVIDHGRFPSYWDFARNYCMLEDNFWGTSIVNNQQDAAQRIKRDFRDIYFARTQDQVLSLPDWIFDVMEIPMSGQQSKMYREMQENFMTLLPEGDVLVAANILAQITRLNQLASNPALVGGPHEAPKWDSVVDILEFEQLPAIIWTNFIPTAVGIRALLQKSKLETRLLTGETSTVDRDLAVRNFQEGKVDAMIAHPGVGKFGLTLTAARTAIYAERSYNGDDYYQSLHRVRRIGTTQSPHVIILLSNLTENIDGELIGKPTIDHVIHRVLGFKRENSVQITTGLIREVLHG